MSSWNRWFAQRPWLPIVVCAVLATLALWLGALYLGAQAG